MRTGQWLLISKNDFAPSWLLERWLWSRTAAGLQNHSLNDHQTPHYPWWSSDSSLLLMIKLCLSLKELKNIDWTIPWHQLNEYLTTPHTLLFFIPSSPLFHLPPSMSTSYIFPIVNEITAGISPYKDRAVPVGRCVMVCGLLTPCICSY